MQTNILNCSFNGRSDAYAARALYQWDRGIVLRFPDLRGLPNSYEVHFSNSPLIGQAIRRVGTAAGVSIPDSLLETGKPIFAWLVLQAGEDDSETVYACKILVTPRPAPVDVTPTPAQQSALDEAIAALNATTFTAAEKTKLSGVESGAEANVIEAVRIWNELRQEYVPLSVTGKKVDLPRTVIPEEVLHVTFEIEDSGDDLVVTSASHNTMQVINKASGDKSSIIAEVSLDDKVFYLPLAEALESPFACSFAGAIDDGVFLRISVDYESGFNLGWRVSIFSAAAEESVDSIDEALTDLQNCVGDINNLTTTDKSSFVAAINELVARVAALER